MSGERGNSDLHASFSSPLAALTSGLNELQIAFVCREILKVRHYIIQ